MLQNGSCQNSHLSINVIFKRLGVKAGINSLPFVVFVTPNKERIKGKWVTIWKRASFFLFLYSTSLQRTLNLLMQR